jgi:hypothetical protein
MALCLEPDRAALSISKWIDTEITPKIDSWWKKGVADLISVSILRNGGHAITTAAPLLKAMQLMSECGHVNMDELASILNQVIDRQPDGKIHALSIGLALDKSDVIRLMSVASSYAPNDTTPPPSVASSASASESA